MASKKANKRAASVSGSEESEEEELIFNNEAGYDYSKPQQRTEGAGTNATAGGHNFVHLHF